jgi:hypothetical protein
MMDGLMLWLIVGIVVVSADGLHEQDPMQGASMKNQIVGLLQAVQYLKGENGRRDAL